ncbi:MAG: DUF1905 domain-containing protein [Mycobacteriales bacterium]
MQLDFDAPLWLHDEGSWHFVSVPLELSDELRDRVGPATGGFGSIRVAATIGGTTWPTSVFPSASGEYVLPVKQQVRRTEGLSDGDVVSVQLVPQLSRKPSG